MNNSKERTKNPHTAANNQHSWNCLVPKRVKVRSSISLSLEKEEEAEKGE